MTTCGVLPGANPPGANPPGITALLCCCVLLASGCPENPDHAVIEISASSIDASDLDTIEVTFAVARDSAGQQVCEPYTVAYPLNEYDLPLAIEVIPGTEWNQTLFVRIEGLRSGTVRFRQERAATLTGGDVGVEVEITVDCLDTGTGSGSGQHCISGQVQESPFWRIFDEGLYVQAGETCRNAE